MKALRRDPFPFEAARDLLGILRAMYAADRARAASGAERRLKRTAEVAGELRAALDLAMESPPGSLGHAAALERASAVALRAQDLIDCTTPLEPLLRSAVLRLRSRVA